MTVRIDLSRPFMTVPFQIGVTHTHGFWEYGNAVAVERAADLLREGISFQNQHIMGWGAGNPEPQSGVFVWDDLDHRVDLMRSIGTTMIITFCTAPGWMKGTDDWAMEEEVEDAHVEAFAELCAAVAARFTDVEYFQVWNEMKGYWSNPLNNWDYVRYTAMYNEVWDAVKSVRPDAKIGGPYLVIQGDGGAEIGKGGRDTFKPIGSRDWDVIHYWLENKRGADFFCFDYGLIDYHDPNAYSPAEKMKLTKHFGLIVSQIREKTDMPVVISEFYGGMDAGDMQFIAANHASCYVHAILNQASLALVWNPQEGEIDNFLFTRTMDSNGGQATDHYLVVRAIQDYFPKGTQLYPAVSSSEDVEALASAGTTLLINKTENALNVDVNGEIVALGRYEVRVIVTPQGTRARENPRSRPSTEINIFYRPSGPVLQVMLPSPMEVYIQVFNILGKKLEDHRCSVDGHSIQSLPLFRNSRDHPSGIYLVRLSGAGIHSVKRFCLLE